MADVILDDHVLKETARWLVHAREDYDQALRMRNQSLRHCCFWANQSAEKAIKSIFVFLRLAVPKTDDLDELVQALPDGWMVKGHSGNLSALNRWPQESQYPDYSLTPSEADADAAISLAERVLSSVEEDLRAHGYS
jgi:HEPN domain-containing protein